MRMLGEHSAGTFEWIHLKGKDKLRVRRRMLETLRGQRVTQAECSYKKLLQAIQWQGDDLSPQACRRAIDLDTADELEQAREVLRRIPGVSANGMANQLGIGNARAAELLAKARIPKRRCWFCGCEDTVTERYDRGHGWNRTTEGSNLTRKLSGKDICDDCQRGYDNGTYRAVAEKLCRSAHGPAPTLEQILRCHETVELVNLYQAQEAAA